MVALLPCITGITKADTGDRQVTAVGHVTATASPDIVVEITLGRAPGLIGFDIATAVKVAVVRRSGPKT